MVTRPRWLFVVVAALLLGSCTPYDLDNIYCQGDGQCPTGFYCELGDGVARLSSGVCVQGDNSGAAGSAVVVGWTGLRDAVA